MSFSYSLLGDLSRATQEEVDEGGAHELVATYESAKAGSTNTSPTPASNFQEKEMEKKTEKEGLDTSKDTLSEGKINELPQDEHSVKAAPSTLKSNTNDNAHSSRSTHHFNGNMNSMTDSMNGMQMTFSSLGEYRVTLLFNWWKVDTPLEFFIAWVLVCSASILFHAVRYANQIVESTMLGDKRNFSIFGSQEDNTESSIFGVSSSRKYRKTHSSPDSNLRAVHSLIAAFNYGLSLMLMLVAMTFNSALFVALIFGYLIGDYLFFHLNPVIFSENDSCH